MESNIEDIELVPLSLAPIAPFLRVAKDIEADNPRVAYLCRFQAFSMAHAMDPQTKGRGVLRFKKYLLLKIQKEEVTTKHKLGKNDLEEIKMYYKKFYKENIEKGQENKTPEEMGMLYHTASVLYEVLEAMIPQTRIDEETRSYKTELERNYGQYAHYYYLPLSAFDEVPKTALTKSPSLPQNKAAPSHLPKSPSVSSWFNRVRRLIFNQKNPLRVGSLLKFTSSGRRNNEGSSCPRCVELEASNKLLRNEIARSASGPGVGSG